MKTFLSKHPDKFLSMVLWLVAILSIAIGVALITQPVFLMEWLGFGSEHEPFFPAQGGVFHLLMSVAYLLGAMDSQKYYVLIIFSIIVKAGAALFLFIYCLTIEFKWVILTFGIVDGVVGLTIFSALRHYLYFQITNDRR
jgi:hypothetical protein